MSEKNLKQKTLMSHMKHFFDILRKKIAFSFIVEHMEDVSGRVCVESQRREKRDMIFCNNGRNKKREIE